MVDYFFLAILSSLPLVEGELLGLGKILLLISCLPLVIYLRQQTVKFGRQECLFLGFLFFALLATIFSQVFPRSLNNFFLYLAYFIYFLTAKNLGQSKKEDLQKWLTLSIIFSALILSFLSFSFLILNRQPVFSVMNLIFANYGHNHLVDFLIFAFPLSLTLLIKEKQGLKKIGLWFLNLIFMGGFVFSFSRGGILMAILILALVALGFWKSEIKRLRQHFFYLGLGLSLIFILAVFGFYFINQKSLNLTQENLISKLIREIPLKNRLDYWRQSLLAIKERPFWGWGLDNFRYVSVKYQSRPLFWSAYAHNHFLEMFVETGIFGGIIFFALILAVIIPIFRRCLAQFKLNLNWAFSVALIVSALHSFFDFDWQFPAVFLLFWVLAGYLSPHKREKIGSTHQGVKLGLFFIGLLLFLLAILELLGNLLLFWGVKEQEKGNWQRAEGLYQKSLSLWPFKLETWQVSLKAYRDQGKTDLALDLLNSLIVIEPSDKNYKSLGDLYLKDNISKAKDYYWQATQFNPLGSLAIYEQLLDLEGEAKDKNWPEIFKILTKIETVKGEECILMCLGPEREAKILNLLLQLIKEPNFESLNPEQKARVFYWLAVLSSPRQEWPNLVEWLTEATQLDDQETYERFLSDALIAEKIKEAASSEDWQTIEKLAPRLIEEAKAKNYAFHQKFYLEEAYSFLAEANFAKEQYDQAFSLWQEAKEINPGGDKPYLGLGKYYRYKNDLGQAKKILRECVQINSWSQECQRELDILEKKKRDVSLISTPQM